MSWDMSTPRVLSPGDRIDVVETGEYPVVDWNGNPWTTNVAGAKPIEPGQYEIQMIVKRLDPPPRGYRRRCVPSYQLVLVSVDGPVLRRRIKVSPNKQLRRVVEGVQS